ncbi:Tetratricopeptide repeat-containing protein [Halopenitus malekzadehii]|uniref:Tetratricopeptide repeat-containing protein n=1 Tax=Halopenitus malekzadehii TaxID=1267564 RepID=A0A1H6IUS4_9EURY|nr:tetratricopeptide repeat protein [Halopenitus malekzadehii]SEH50216.1 Tetratricopeptide repeat-containing protein [Halopenitus malekzadehii]
MTDEPDDHDHEFSAGQGLEEDYEEFTLDPPELNADPSAVDPVDTRVITDALDRRNIADDQVDVEQLLDVGLSYMGINRFEEATGTFERAAMYASEDSLDAQEAWVNKGVAHAELEEYDEAIGAYEEALRIDDDSEHAATAETNLAYALWEFGRHEEALEHAERAVEIDPRFAQAWYNRGFFLLERGLAEDAVTAFNNAIRLGHRNADVLEEKARALEETGEHDEAEEVAEEAEQLRQERERELVEEHGGGGPVTDRESGGAAGGARGTDPGRGGGRGSGLDGNAGGGLGGGLDDVLGGNAGDGVDGDSGDGSDGFDSERGGR